MSRRVPLGLQRGAAPLPGIRALLDHLSQRLRGPACRELYRPAGVGLARCRSSARRSPHAVLGRHDDRGQRHRRPGQPHDVGAGRRANRRHLGRQDGRLRQRVHARYRRHVGGHRGRRRRRAQDAPPARYQDRRLSGHDPDGGYRHHRRGRRLHRLCRRRRHLPRRTAIGRRRPGAGLLRPRRQRAHIDRRSGGARPAPHRSRPGRRADDAARGPRPRGRPASRRHARHVA